jgi:hypothetical protein
LIITKLILPLLYYRRECVLLYNLIFVCTIDNRNVSLLKNITLIITLINISHCRCALRRYRKVSINAMMQMRLQRRQLELAADALVFKWRIFVIGYGVRMEFVNICWIFVLFNSFCVVSVKATLLRMVFIVSFLYTTSFLFVVTFLIDGNCCCINEILVLLCNF